MVVRPRWVAAAHDAWHCGALVLVTAIGPCSGQVTRPALPRLLPGPDGCRTRRQTRSVQGRRNDHESDAEGALDRFRLGWRPERDSNARLLLRSSWLVLHLVRQRHFVIFDVSGVNGTATA